MQIRLKLVTATKLNENEKAMLAVELEQALKDTLANDPKHLPTLTEYARRVGNEDERFNIEVFL